MVLVQLISASVVFMVKLPVVSSCLFMVLYKVLLYIDFLIIFVVCSWHWRNNHVTITVIFPWFQQ
jgi:hypothetical protein